MAMIKLIALILVIIGALNWGLAVFGVNLVVLIFGGVPVVEKIIYALIGLSGIYLIFGLRDEFKSK